MPRRPVCHGGKDIKGIIKKNSNIQQKSNESKWKNSYNKNCLSIYTLNFIQFDEISENESPEFNDLSEYKILYLIFSLHSIRNRTPPEKKCQEKMNYYTKTCRSFRYLSVKYMEFCICSTTYFRRFKV